MSQIITKNPEPLKKAKRNEFEFGLLPDYTKIGEYRSDSYANRKYLKNPLAGYGQVDLINTGAFVNSLFVLPLGGNRYTFDSGNSKAGLLSTAYSKDIFGLNQRTFTKIDKQEYAPKLRQYTIKLIRQG